MIKLGKLILNGTPRIAVGFNDRTNPTILMDAKKLGLDIAELRIDQYSSFEKKHVLKQISKFRHFPTIATIRSKKEGGGWNLSESARLQLFETIIPKIDAIDIELSSKEILPKVIKKAQSAKKSVVISYHNFDRTPDVRALSKILKEAKTLGADIVKIATMALRKADVQALAAFTSANASQNLVTIAMGSEGLISRIFFPVLGSLITHAYLGEPTAPGQLHYEKTFDYLRLFYPKFNQEKIRALQLFQNV